MNWFSRTFSSSIGKKVLMSLTGLFLCSFLVVHLSGNLQLLKNDKGLAFNSYAVFMTSFTPIKVISYLLYTTILFHAAWGLALAYKNMQARKSKYAVKAGNATSFWASRWMGVLGTIILVFITVHMADFWWGYHNEDLPYVQYVVDKHSGHMVSADTTIAPIEAKMETMEVGNTEIIITKDLFREVYEAFKNPLLVLLYVVAMIALAYHLVHGFKSAFQTLGINHRKYNGIIRFIGVWVFGILIPFLFALLPVYIHFINR